PLSLHKQIFERKSHVRYGPTADICSAKRHVRFTPESGHVQCKSRCSLWIGPTQNEHANKRWRNSRCSGWRTLLYIRKRTFTTTWIAEFPLRGIAPFSRFCEDRDGHVQREFIGSRLTWDSVCKVRREVDMWRSKLAFIGTVILFSIGFVLYS